MNALGRRGLECVSPVCMKPSCTSGTLLLIRLMTSHSSGLTTIPRIFLPFPLVISRGNEEGEKRNKKL